MSLSSLARRWRRRSTQPAGPRRPRPAARSFRPRLEGLEDRFLPSTVVGVGTNTNLSKMAGNQNEGVIAVNPANPNNLFVVGNNESTTNGLFLAASLDKGQTWAQTTGNFPGNVIDAQAAFDSFGNLYMVLVTATKDVYVTLSTDGGQHSSQLTLVTDGAADRSVVAAGSGSVWVAYHDKNNKIAAFGAKVTALGAVGTFSTPIEVPSSTGGNFPDLAVGPTGQVLVTFQLPGGSSSTPDTVDVSLDSTANLQSDGTGAGAFANPVLVTNTNVKAGTVIPAQSNAAGIDAEPKLAWDRARGRIYLAYTDSPAIGSADTNVFLRTSTDATTWTAPVQVNIDATTRSQFLPTLAVDPASGAVGVAWYDARNDPANTKVQLFAAFSTNGGVSFMPNVQVSAGATSAPASEPPPSGLTPLGLGDFIKAAFLKGNFYVVWADNSNSTHDNPDGTLSKLDLVEAPVSLVSVPSLSAVTYSATSVSKGGSITVSGSFTDADTFRSHAVVVNWGDGTPPTTLNLPPGTFSFSASHTFPEESPPQHPYQVTVTVFNDGGQSAAATPQSVLVTGAPLSAVLGVPGQPPTAFVVSTTHSLYYVSGAAPLKLGDFVQSISAVTEASGNNMVFAILTNNSLYKFDLVHGWQPVGAAGTVFTVSAGTDRSGFAEAYAALGGGAFAEFDTVTGWRLLNPPGQVFHVSAANNGLAAVILADGSVFVHDDSNDSWTRLTNPAFARSVSAVTQTDGTLVVYIVAVDSSLYRFSSVTGYSLVGASGTIQAASAGLDSAGKADVFVLTTANDFVKLSNAFGWQTLGARNSIQFMSAGGFDRVFAVGADGTLLLNDVVHGWQALSGPGFALP